MDKDGLLAELKKQTEVSLAEHSGPDRKKLFRDCLNGCGVLLVCEWTQKTRCHIERHGFHLDFPSSLPPCGVREGTMCD